MSNKKVVIMRGLPGSGKDAYLKSLEKADGLKIATCSADDHFMKGGEYFFNVAELTKAHDACFNKFVLTCRNSGIYKADNCDIIAVSNTNSQLFEISPYLMYARLEGLEVEIVEVFIPHTGQPLIRPEVYALRGIHGVPTKAIENMAKQWEDLPPFWPAVTRVESRLGGGFADASRTIPHWKAEQ